MTRLRSLTVELAGTVIVGLTIVAVEHAHRWWNQPWATIHWLDSTDSGQ